MKKILLILTLIFYVLLSTILINLYSNSSLINNIEKSTYTINVIGWNKDVTSYEKNLQINSIAQKNKINIFKIYFIPNKGTNDIEIYSAIGNESELNKLFPIKFNKGETYSNLNKTTYLSNSLIDTPNNIGSLNLLNSNNLFLKKLIYANESPIASIYFIQGGNYEKTVKLFESIGLQVKNTTSNIKNNNYLSNININMNVLIAVLLIFISIIITYLYYLVSSFKEYSIKVISGYSKKDIWYWYIIDILKLNIIPLIVSIIFTWGYTYLKFKYGTIAFLGYCFKFYLPICLLTIILMFLLSFLVYKVNIYSAIKNKKPLKLLQTINFIIKYISLFIVVLVITNLISNFIIRQKVLKDEEYWKGTSNYSYTEFKYQPTNTTYICELGFKFKQFFSDVNKESILVKPSLGITGIDGSGSMYNTSNYLQATSPNNGNTIFVNANYLNKNKIYYSDGKVVNIKPDYGNFLIVLIPQEYKPYYNEIEANYQKWYQFKKYINRYMYQMSIGDTNALSPQDYPPVKVDIRFIANNQKTPLYTLEKPYSTNSCIVIINGENIGGDTYANLVTGGYLYINNQYNNSIIINAAAKSGLSNYLVATPNLYSKISNYIYKLKKDLYIDLFSIIILLFVQFIVGIFSTLNYIERTKIIHAIKTVNGFSFFEINKKFMLYNIVAYIVTYVIILGFLPVSNIISLLIILIIFIINSILFIITNKILNKNILKNILNKE